MASCSYLLHVLLSFPVFILTFDLFLDLFLLGSRSLIRLWLWFWVRFILIIGLGIGFLTLRDHLSTTSMLLFRCFQLWECLLDFLFDTMESIVWVGIRLHHSLGIFIMPLHLCYFPLLLFCLAGLFLPFAPLFLLANPDFIDPTLFFSLDTGFLFAVEVETVGASFGDDNLSRDIITSSESLITN